MVYKVLRIYHLQLKEGLWEVSVSHLHRMVTDQGHEGTCPGRDYRVIPEESHYFLQWSQKRNGQKNRKNTSRIWYHWRQGGEKSLSVKWATIPNDQWCLMDLAYGISNAFFKFQISDGTSISLFNVSSSRLYCTQLSLFSSHHFHLRPKVMRQFWFTKGLHSRLWFLSMNN